MFFFPAYEERKERKKEKMKEEREEEREREKEKRRPFLLLAQSNIYFEKNSSEKTI